MNNKDRIILYLDDQLSSGEREKFEEDLSNNPELRKELENYKKMLGNLKSMNILSADELYFVNNIPRFREKPGGKRKRAAVKGIIYASSALVIVFLILSLFLFKGPEKISDAKDYTITEEQVKNLTDNYSNIDIDNAASAVGDSVWDELISDEFNFSSETADSILQSLNGSVNYTEGLNEEEASLIYDRLINKEFF
ncbi:MAG TPA: hypothetical protein VMT35_04935 [Ignavibacteriaceae bacterium]|nr:hypothetical protein [Ignavibacteriaceae bacterium]